MKGNVFLCLLLCSVLGFSQQEASNWYFGKKAGLKFDSNGTVTPLTDGQLDTLEGCATISDNNGNLLFYTDGVTVYNKIHQTMSNGTGLMGDDSTTQSATILQKPGSNNLFYVFTLAVEAGVNGFRYSVVDLSLNGGLGAVTDKNILIYTPSCEKLSVVKHANGIDYWVITHGWNSNIFYSHLVTSAGPSSTPITSASGIVVNNTSVTNAMGYMKISPNGHKLVLCHQFLERAELFDFDNATGQISNPKTLITNDYGQLYGAEFSPDNSVLYISTNISLKIYQFNLNALNIAASKIEINTTGELLGAMQLGPDGKIYVALYNSYKLGVINNPNVLGFGCNFQNATVDLGGKMSKEGLPSFVQSFFYAPSITFQNNCLGQTASFNLNNSQNIISALWDFGDGMTSTAITPSHVYATAGTYHVTVTTTGSNGIGNNNRDIIIYDPPHLNATNVNLKQCDDDLDGFSAFNINQSNSLLVSNASGLIFSFFKYLQDAQNNVTSQAITNSIAYINSTINNDTVFVRVENANRCYATAQINLQVSTTLIPSSFQITKRTCDDDTSGSNTDGIASFDFSDVTAQVQALYPSGQLLTIAYYKNEPDALAETNEITNISSYINTGTPHTQNIYIRVDSQVNNECLGLGHHLTLIVDRIPIIQPQKIRHCDDNQDGKYSFDTTNLQNDLLNGLNNVEVTYATQSGTPVVMTNPFLTPSQILNVKVKNTFGIPCEYSSTVEFIVDDLPEAFAISTNLTTVCDDEANPALQNGIYPFNTSSFQSSLLGNQTGMIVQYKDALGNQLTSPLPDPFVSSTQNIQVEVTNLTNTSCKANRTISLLVNPVPKIELSGNELICSDNPSFTKVIEARLLDTPQTNSFTYSWYLNNNLIPNQNQFSLTINNQGVYRVC